MGSMGRKSATTLTTGAFAVATLAAGLGPSPSAEASCASLFGFSTDPARCTSSPLGIAVAIGEGAGARADSLLGIAFAAGPGAVAEALGGAANVAVQLGANGTTAADGFLNLAASISLGTTVLGGSEVRAQGGDRKSVV